MGTKEKESKKSNTEIICEKFVDYIHNGQDVLHIRGTFDTEYESDNDYELFIWDKNSDSYIYMGLITFEEDEDNGENVTNLIIHIDEDLENIATIQEIPVDFEPDHLVELIGKLVYSKHTQKYEKARRIMKAITEHLIDENDDDYYYVENEPDDEDEE